MVELSLQPRKWKLGNEGKVGESVGVVKVTQQGWNQGD